MKILHIVRQYAPSVGGLESYVRSLAKHQQEAGNQCAILTLNRVFMPATHLPATDTIDGIPIHRIGYIGFRRYFLPFMNINFLNQFDVIHVHNTDVFFDTIALLKPLLRGKLFATTHGGFFHTSNFSLIKKLYFNTITRCAAKQYKNIFATSENDFDTFKSLTRHLELKPNAVEPLGNYIAAGSDFLYLGRLAPHKNLHGLIHTLAKLKTTHKVPGKLNIIGPEWGVTRNELRELAQQLNIEQHVTIHGFVPDEKMPTILKQCGFFVSGSHFEGFGMSMIEAMSIGLIPYVHTNASFKTLVDQAKIGLALNFDNSEESASAIAQHLLSVTQQMRKQAQIFAATFAWNNLSREILVAYRKTTL